MNLYTVQLSQRHLAIERKIPVLDTTVKSGEPAFAPTWDMVMTHKRQMRDDPTHWEQHDRQYIQAYQAKMARSLHEHPEVWRALWDRPLVALGCYCPPRAFCHRHLLSHLIRNQLHDQGRPCDIHGELVQRKPPTTSNAS